MNDSMKHSLNNRTGFTLVEVSLFLGITGLLLIGILGTTWNSIARQRATDTVQSFADFLRGQYSSTTNVQNSGTGNSNKVIYGRVTTFGEFNEPADAPTKSNGTIYSYDLIGDLKPSDSIIRFNVSEMLTAVNAEVLVSECVDGTCSYGVRGQSEYKPRNGAILKKICYRDSISNNCENTNSLDQLTIIIARSPSSGSIHTYFLRDVLSIQKFLANTMSENILDSEIKGKTFEEKIVDFCIQPQDIANDRLYDVRLNRGANNSSGVEIVNLDSDDNICEREGA